jgi:hypothetical protein
MVAITNAIQENERRWEENNRRWEENHKEMVVITNAIQENERRWEENERRWEENHKEMVAITNAIQENERRWEESRKKDNRRWEENHKEMVVITNAIQENERRWEESRQESKRRWEENNRRWEENHKEMVAITNALQEQNKKIDRKYDQTVGALGSRWGLYSEASFRNALSGILKDFQGVEVINVNEYDEEGVVFGHPDQIELDIIIKNGVLMICEIKSSVNKSDMYIFERKVRFYERKHARQASRMIVISPMLDRYAKPVADKLGIEVYSYADGVEL